MEDGRWKMEDGRWKIEDRLLDSSTSRLLDSSTPRLLDFSTSRLLDFSTSRLLDSVPPARLPFADGVDVETHFSEFRMVEDIAAIKKEGGF